MDGSLLNKDIYKNKIKFISKNVITYSIQGLGYILKKPLVRRDIGFYIPTFNGFPGPYIKYVNKLQNQIKSIKNNG
jgi:inosine/xanthosine triphosphate pyrophosphatase family protein